MEDKIVLRRASPDDALDLLRWRNDPLTVAMSRTPGTVDLTGHRQWLDRVLADPDQILLIGACEGCPCGMVRFSREAGAEWPNLWVVSIGLAPEQRGRGLGRQLLAGAVAFLIRLVGAPLITAEVKTVNHASRRMFESCGFRLTGTEDGYDQFAFSIRDADRG